LSFITGLGRIILAAFGQIHGSGQSRGADGTSGCQNSGSRNTEFEKITAIYILFHFISSLNVFNQ
jgi:hypothetical protein